MELVVFRGATLLDDETILVFGLGNAGNHATARHTRVFSSLNTLQLLLHQLNVRLKELKLRNASDFSHGKTGVGLVGGLCPCLYSFFDTNT